MSSLSCKGLLFNGTAELRGAVLARVMEILRDKGRFSNLFLKVFQDELILLTLDKARASSPFYHDRIPSVSHQSGFDILATLSPLTRTDAVANQERLVSADFGLASMSHTTGTTTGEYFEVYRSLDEQQFITDFFATLQSLDPNLSSEPRPLILSIPIPHHGSPVAIPILGQVFIGGVSDDHIIRDTVKLILSRFRIPRHCNRINVISAPLYCLHFLTSYLHELKFSFSDHQMDGLFTHGQLVTPAQRLFLEGSWGCTLTDRYSLTELFGGATSCTECGGYHFDHWLVPEVVNPVGEATRLEVGPGRLLLTGLYPWMQAQPMIRYDTGDIFESITCPSREERGFRFHGRAGNCAFLLENGSWTLAFSTANAYAVLDDIPDLARGEWFSNVTARDRTPGSLIKMDVKLKVGSKAEIELLLELRYSPHLFPTRSSEIRTDIHRLICDAQPQLARLIGIGRAHLKIEVCGPNTLKKTLAQKI